MSKIYVGQLSDQTSEEALRQLFGEYGNVTHVEMRTGFAFVTFEVEGDAERAIEEVNDKELDGNCIRVERERGTKEGGLRGTDGRIKPPKRLDLRVLIRGLHPKVDWKDLKDWARGVVGEVTYSNVFDRDEQHMGLIELKDEASLERALASLGDVPLLGNQVTVERDAIDSEYSRIPPAGIAPPSHFRSHHNQHHNNFRGGRDRERGYNSRDNYRDSGYSARDSHRDRDYPPHASSFAADPPLRHHSRDRDHPSHFHHRDAGRDHRRDSSRERRDRGDAGWNPNYHSMMPSQQYAPPSLPYHHPQHGVRARERDDPRSFRGGSSNNNDLDHRRFGNDRVGASFQRERHSRERGGDFRFQPQSQPLGINGDGFSYDGPAGRRFREEAAGGGFPGERRRRSHSRSRSRERFSAPNNNIVNSGSSNTSNFNHSRR